MIYWVLLLILGLTFLNLYFGKSVLYPPALFSAIWSVCLLGLIIAGDRFYPLSTASLLIFLMGVIAISIGGGVTRSLVLRRPERALVTSKVSPSRHNYVRRLLDWGLFVCIVGLPFYWQKASAAALASGRAGFFAGVRQENLVAEETLTSISLLDNIVVLAALLAPVVFFENDGSRRQRWRTVIAVVLATAYGALTASKGSPIHLIIVLLVVYWLKVGRPSTSFIVILGITCLGLFVVGIILINLIDLNVYEPIDLVRSGLAITPNYMLGSLVGFDRIFNREQIVENTQSISRGVLGIARKLGADVELPSIHAQYTMISNFENTNTYTLYFSYIGDLGVAGTFVWMVILGMLLTYIYRAALSKHPIAIVLYAVIADAIIFSIHAEHFLLGVNQYGKTLILLLFLYRLPQFKVR